LEPTFAATFLNGLSRWNCPSEEFNKRFEESARQITRWMTTITVLIALIGLMGAWGTFVQ